VLQEELEKTRASAGIFKEELR
jgi:ubiquitin